MYVITKSVACHNLGNMNIIHWHTCDPKPVFVQLHNRVLRPLLQHLLHGGPLSTLNVKLPTFPGNGTVTPIYWSAAKNGIAVYHGGGVPCERVKQPRRIRTRHSRHCQWQSLHRWRDAARFDATREEQDLILTMICGGWIFRFCGKKIIKL